MIAEATDAVWPDVKEELWDAYYGITLDYVPVEVSICLDFLAFVLL